MLSEADLAELKLLLGRRDSWIKFLYQREMEFSSEIERLRSLAASGRPSYFSLKDKLYNRLNAAAPGLVSSLRRTLAPALRAVERRADLHR